LASWEIFVAMVITQEPCLGPGPGDNEQGRGRRR
jgi:hypothetical protein